MVTLINGIRESLVDQGDLVFIFHWTKPYKTGWWRKIKYKDAEKDERGSGKICYVLEIPVHKDYKDNKDDGSRIESGLYLMSQENVKRASIADFELKYEILACLKGVTSVVAPSILKKDMASLLQLKDIQDDRSFVTKHYEAMVKRYYASIEELTRYERLTDDLM